MDEKEKWDTIPTPKYEEDEEWVNTYIEQLGSQPSFFRNIANTHMCGSNTREES